MLLEKAVWISSWSHIERDDLKFSDLDRVEVEIQFRG